MAVVPEPEASPDRVMLWLPVSTAVPPTWRPVQFQFAVPVATAQTETPDLFSTVMSLVEP